MPVKHYTKEEIEEIKHTITPVERVRKDHLFKQTYIDAEACPSLMATKRRRENVNKARG